MPYLEKYQSLISKVNTTETFWSKSLGDFNGGAEVEAFSPQQKREFVLAVFELFDEIKSVVLTAVRADLNYKESNESELAEKLTYIWRNNGALRSVVEKLLQSKLPFEHNDLLILLVWAINLDNYSRRSMPRIVENYLKGNPLTAELQDAILKLAQSIDECQYSNADTRKLSVRLKEVGNLSKNQMPLTAGEAWADAAIAAVESFDETTKNAWLELLNICRKATGGAPNAKWLKEAAPLFDKIGFENFKSSILKWFPLADKPRTELIAEWSEWSPNPNEMLDEANADILKALVWLCGKREDRELARALTALANSAYRKVAKIGPRCVRVGNAAVWALGAMPGDAAIGQLALLKLKIKFGTAQKGIEKALNTAAARVGLPPEEIEEMSVPAYGLDENGVRREPFGDFTAELVVTGTTATELRWFNADGKQQKSVPKFVRDNHAAEWKELTAAAKDIKAMLPAQRDRIDNFYLGEKRWQFPVWRERYLKHGLVGTIARRLIWQFSRGAEKTAAIWFDGKFLAGDGREVAYLDDETTVELWHPLFTHVDGVLEWRAFLQEREIQQPFKQAHREIYLLTDAERATRTYSNRFAAHIVKQHQFNSLCAVRGWKSQLRLMVDDSYAPPTRVLPEWNLRAEFWVETMGENYGEDTTESGSYLYLTTDQLRFYPINARQNYVHAGGGGYSASGWRGTGETTEPLLLEQIPALVLSEIMRDVDLFVGVASVGNDQTWTNGRSEGGANNYWQSYSFGELSETAKTRHEVLSKLVPRLKIAARCTLEDKFLTIRGDFRNYKIHLGSGNILMSPNDQYLCIVPSSSAEVFSGGKVFLPFEGDRTLAIILSKAFLLAADAKITDPTIVRQITLS